MQVNKIPLKVSLFQYALYKVLQLKRTNSSKGLRRKSPVRVSRNCVTYRKTDAVVERGRRFAWVFSMIMEKVANWCYLAVPWEWTPAWKLLVTYWEHWRPAHRDLGHSCSGPWLLGEGPCHSICTKQRNCPKAKTRGEEGAREGEEGARSGTPGNGQLPRISQTVFSPQALWP